MNRIQKYRRVLFTIDLLFSISAFYLIWYNIVYNNLDITDTSDAVNIGYFILLGFAFFIAGFGLLYRKKWARILHFPLGTLSFNPNAVWNNLFSVHLVFIYRI